MNRNYKLYVRNVEQAAAWLELDGQLSDGHWENARPMDHWRPWCHAEVIVAEPGAELGRTFSAVKDNYNFTDKSLWDVVGLRMLAIARIARALGIHVAELLEHAPECETGLIDWTASWNEERMDKLARLGVTQHDVDAALRDETYTIKHLRADVTDLKAIVRRRLFVGGVE